MRTRRAAYAPCHASPSRKRYPLHPSSSSSSPKKPRSMAAPPCNGLDLLHDDLVLSVMICVARTAACPADLVNLTLTCKKFSAIGSHPLVLINANTSVMAVKATGWSEGAHRFLKRCADAGNVEACYTLGMIRFYCLRHTGGLSVMARAAMAGHAGALHSLSVIQFNGSGRSRGEKDLRGGVALCAKAASLGHVDAMRELGHCLQDGYGVPKNVIEGRRLLLEANAREAAAAVASSPPALMEIAAHLKMSATLCFQLLCFQHHHSLANPAKHESGLHKEGKNDHVFHHTVYKLLMQRTGGCSLLSDFGCNVPPPEIHIANKFLKGWFDLHDPSLQGLRLCSYSNCGRPETRSHEFRRCSVCGKANYCCRACQALDWRIRHKFECQPPLDDGGDGNNNDNHENDDDEIDGDDDDVDDDDDNVEENDDGSQ